jgi:hypothetical protein
MSVQAIEGCLLLGCMAASLVYGPLVLIVGFLSLVAAEVAIDRMRRDHLLERLDQKTRRR